jgi:hypothetical protein
LTAEENQGLITIDFTIPLAICAKFGAILAGMD